MATILLAAAGAAAGASVGGGILGLSSVVIGRAVGATVGRLIDQSLLGAGSAPVEQGKVDRFRLMGASEGTAVPRLYGRMRIAGQVIWASDFLEDVKVSGGGKGTPSTPKTEQYSYSVSVAIALCEGEIGRVGRIWADGAEIAPADLNMRVYTGTEDQLPDPKIKAVEGAGEAPAYRGIAYVVIEDLPLGPYGNRVPQFSFEVVRPAEEGDVARDIRGVALMPGTGEYALATTPVYMEVEPGVSRAANVNSPMGVSDLEASLGALVGEVPGCQSVSLVVSWFGDDLRAGSCQVAPRVEQQDVDGKDMPWTVSGLTRGTADQVPVGDDGVVYGGTPTDQSVIEAIAAMNDAGLSVMFYPFLLMTQGEGNVLTDPWTGDEGQPVLPWRGRITTSLAPGVAGSPDGTAVAEAEVAAFFGTAQVSDFVVTPEGIDYTGPAEFSYRRFVLHYAHLCAAAGGVGAFCIGSEMRSLTQVRGASGFPAVAAFQQLAADVRAILGAGVKIGYAADWSEYFGYQPRDGSGDVLFHLDPLWADANVDFIGIDNYMPLSDWRDGTGHADAEYGSIYNLSYLKENVAGGEGFDWYYHAPEAEAAQNRTPITDGAYDEPWVFRYKDLVSWWSQPHHNRPGGVRDAMQTAWLPRSKPIWFTEMGCPAVDKGTNQPNVFYDPKSSESALPRYSNGRRDDLIQRRYLAAMLAHWGDGANNPVSEIYGGPMVDMTRAHVWAWDARPYPQFPGNAELWSDSENWVRGHWITGRISARGLDSVVREICAGSGVTAVETEALYGLVRGYVVDDLSGARAALQPLMLAHGFDAVEREGALRFQSRDGIVDAAAEEGRLAVWDEDGTGDLVATRLSEAEVMGRVKVSFVLADGAYEVSTAEAIFPDEESFDTAVSELPMALTAFEAAAIAERWLAEARVARDRIKFALPLSDLAVGAGDVLDLGGRSWRIDRVEQTGYQQIEAVRVEPEIYVPSDAVEEAVRLSPFVAPVPVLPVFLDLPLLTGDEVEHAPHLAVTASPWPGSVAVYDSATDENFALNSVLAGRAVVGVTESALFRAPPGLYDRGTEVRVRLQSGSLQSVSEAELLAGTNVMSIGTGTDDVWELFQFRDAVLVGENTYDLSMRLRGQLGTDALMPDDWPSGSRVVFLNAAVEQIELASSNRRVARTYRIGPADRPLDDPIYTQQVRAFDGVGLRPYAPVHLEVADESGDLRFDWVRRTRIEGDNWDQYEVPLGEAFEAYLVRVMDGVSVVREVQVSAPEWVYDAAAQAADGLGGVFALEVAQMSDRFGPGLFARIEVGS